MDIKQIQQIVGVTPDGINGPRTQAAIKAYQSAHGLTPDGIVGAKTLAVMQQATAKPTTSPTTSTTPFNPLGGNLNIGVNPPATAPATPPKTTQPTIYANGLAPDDPSNVYNTATGQLNTNYKYYVAPTTQNNSSNNSSTNNTAGTNNNSTNPNNANTNSSTTSATTNPSGAASAGAPIPYDPSLATSGITQDIWNQMSPTQQAVVAAAAGAAKSLYGANASNVTLQSALQAASTDPNITAKYADALKMDSQQFQQGLQQISVSSSTQSQQQQQQFELDRKALAEQNAAAGTAYSGFREQAQNNLAQNESNIVTSSRSQLQQQLNDATSAYESKYGTAATTPASTQFVDPFASAGTSISGLSTGATPNNTTLTGQLAGGITGTAPIQKQQDINNLASNYVTLGQLPS